MNKEFYELPLNPGEPLYARDPMYIQIEMLLGSKNYRAIKNMLDIAIEDQPEAFSKEFIAEVDILGQVLDENITEEELGKRNYPANLLDFTKSILKKFYEIVFKK